MSRKAFTLIELLVVVAVLALLASIVFSNLGGAREGARISNALSFQSQTHSLLGSDLVGWWNFDEGSGTTARDISGYDNNGTIYGATHVDGVPGTLGSALSFDGVNDYVDVGNDTILAPDYITISTWIKVNSFVSGQENWVLAKPFDGAPWETYGFRVVDSDTIRFDIHTTSVDLSPNFDFTSGDWFLITATFNGSTVELYKNDEQATSNSLGGVLNYEGNLHNLQFGDRKSSNYFNGLIDDVRIYSRALTASEIQTLYAQTKDKYLAENE